MGSEVASCFIAIVLAGGEAAGGALASVPPFTIDDARAALRRGDFAEAACLAREILAQPVPAGAGDRDTAGECLDLLTQALLKQGPALREDAFQAAEAAIANRERGGLSLELAASLARPADLPRNRAEREIVRGWLERCLAIREAFLGPEDPGVAQALSDLAEASRRLGQFDGLVEIHERALAIRVRAYGERSLEAAASLENLALVLDDVGAAPAALERFERALDIRRSLQGDDDLATAQTKHLVAILLKDMDRHAESDELFRSVLAIRAARLPPNDVDLAATRVSYGNLLAATGRLDEALASYETALTAWQQVLGEDHPWVGGLLMNLAQLHRRRGESERALPLLERALAIQVARLGERDLMVAMSLGHLAKFREERGEYSAARAVFDQALDIQVEKLGLDNPTVASTLGDLGNVFREEGRFVDARVLIEASLTILEAARGRVHAEVANARTVLGMLLRTLNDLEGASLQLEEALVIKEELLGSEHPSVAVAQRDLANLLHVSGRLDDAMTLHERAIATLECTLGSAHPSIAASLNDLGYVLQDAGRYSDAKALYERAIAIDEAAGLAGPEAATPLLNLGAVQALMGDNAGARATLERCLVLTESMPDPNLLDVALVLSNSGTVLDELGEFKRARSLLERALRIRQEVLGEGHPEVAMTLSNLGTLAVHEGDSRAAADIFERVVAIEEAALPAGHPRLPSSLGNLVEALVVSGDLERAERFAGRALDLADASLGRESPDNAIVIGQVATLRAVSGDLDEARRLLARARDVFSLSLGPDHPLLGTTSASLACVEAASGHGCRGHALDLALLAEDIGRANLRLTSQQSSEREALRHAAVRPRNLDLALSLAMALGDDACGRAWDAVVRSRALVLDEMALRRRTLGASDDAETTARVARLAAARERFVNLAVRGSSDDPMVHGLGLDAARRELDKAERAVAERSLEFRAALGRRHVGLADVLGALPAGSALVAYVRHARLEVPADEAAPMAPMDVRAALTGNPSLRERYAALVAGPDGATRLVDIGAASEVDALVAAWRHEAAGEPGRAGRSPSRGEATCRDRGTALRSRAWDPVAPLLAGAERVFLVPDGALHLVSFAALPMAGGTYMVEAGPTLHYLSAERDLVRPQGVRDRRDGLVALGAPDFDATPWMESSAGLGTSIAARIPDRNELREGRLRCEIFATRRFSALPASRGEAVDVGETWRVSRHLDAAAASVRILSGVDASEGAFKHEGPRCHVLHVATHGFFEGEACHAAASAAGTTSPSPFVVGDNPLLLSGLALSGANRLAEAPHAGDDGILTAEEIASLDLSRVQWAVLSACGTGLGTVQGGEGVLGLRRAFEVAGAGTVVMSLWSVGDEATRAWMRALYEARLVRSLDTPASIREASLATLRARRAAGLDTHPFWWAAFVAAGDWR